jgi:D-lactate dehydrogenase
MAAKTAAALWRWSEAGKLPVVTDASSCAQGLLQEVAPRLSEAERERFEQIEILDSIAWAHDRLLPRLRITAKVSSAAVHPTCSAAHLGLTDKLEAIARQLADEVIVPASASGCGMAGDRGLLHPELPASALRDEAAELGGRPIDVHLCSNRTCEIGLRGMTGAPYASFVLALERATRPVGPVSSRLTSWARARQPGE